MGIDSTKLMDIFVNTNLCTQQCIHQHILALHSYVLHSFEYSNICFLLQITYCFVLLVLLFVTQLFHLLCKIYFMIILQHYPNYNTSTIIIFSITTAYNSSSAFIIITMLLLSLAAGTIISSTTINLLLLSNH